MQSRLDQYGRFRLAIAGDYGVEHAAECNRQWAVVAAH
jgi:hypothetical protein